MVFLGKYIHLEQIYCYKKLTAFLNPNELGNWTLLMRTEYNIGKGKKFSKERDTEREEKNK